MDVQPTPGSGTYLRDLNSKLEEAQSQVLAVGSLDCDRADTQISRAVAMQRMHELLALIATEEGNTKACIQNSKEARDWSTQQTRAKTGETPDKLNELIAEVARLKGGGSKLRLIAD